MYYYKLYRQGADVLLAVCDSEIHNQRFEGDSMSFYVDPSFYGDEEGEEEQILDLIERANIINLAGRNCVDLALRLGLVDPGNVLKIGSCSHAQVVRI